MKNITGARRIVISAVVLAVAGVVAVMMLASRPASSDMAGMAGMDHGSGDAHASSSSPSGSGDMPGMDMSGMDMSGGASTPTPTPTPSMAADMPGMDMSGTEPTPTPTPTPSMAADMPGMDMSGDHEHATTAASARPLAPVLGTFGGGTSAVLLAAGFLRRKDRIANQAKQAARATRRSAK